MKNTESNSSLEEAFELAKDKPDSKENSQRILRRSFSDDILPSNKKTKENSPTTIETKIKSKLRFSSAFRSLRGPKSSTKKSSSTSIVDRSDREASTAFSEDTSLEDQSKLDIIEKDTVLPKTQKKKYKLTKKFSLSNIKKHKIAPKKHQDSVEENITSIGNTSSPTYLERHTPEGGNFSASHGSLIESPSGGEDTTESTSKFDKVRKIQITISGKKIDRPQKNKLTTITTEQFIVGDIGGDYLAATSEPAKIDQKSESIRNSKRTDISSSDKINITQSIRDTPPRERAPARPESNPNTPRRDLSPFSLTESDVSVRGAVRKFSLPAGRIQRQFSRDEYFDIEPTYMRQEGIERGRRYPRPTITGSNEQLYQREIRTQDHSPISGGNSLQNPNLSGAISDPFEDTDDRVHRERVRFSVGAAVRSREGTLIQDDWLYNRDLSSVGSFESHGSPVSDTSSTRKRIRYIDQATFYTDEEREILEGKRKVYNNLAEISEYSFDSEFSTETQMPAFGDLTIDNEEPPIMTSPIADKREHLYKILVIGELGTGKTSFIKRYVHQFFSQNYRATIGVDFALKVLHWDQNTIIRLQLWDIAGQERFGNMTRVYYKEAVGAFIVFDVTRSATFDAVIKWKQDLDSKVQLPDGNPIPCILLANKCDQQKQGTVTTSAKLDEYVEENGFSGWFETSAKENINIEDASRALVNKILLNDKLINAGDILDNDKFNLAGNAGQNTAQSPKKNCSC